MGEYCEGLNEIYHFYIVLINVEEINLHGVRNIISDDIKRLIYLEEHKECRFNTNGGEKKLHFYQFKLRTLRKLVSENFLNETRQICSNIEEYLNCDTYQGPTFINFYREINLNYDFFVNCYIFSLNDYIATRTMQQPQIDPKTCYISAYYAIHYALSKNFKETYNNISDLSDFVANLSMKS